METTYYFTDFGEILSHLLVASFWSENYGSESYIFGLVSFRKSFVQVSTTLAQEQSVSIAKLSMPLIILKKPPSPQ